MILCYDISLWTFKYIQNLWILITLNVEWEWKCLDTLVKPIDLICRKWVMSFNLTINSHYILSLSFTLVKTLLSYFTE